MCGMCSVLHKEGNTDLLPLSPTALSSVHSTQPTHERNRADECKCPHIVHQADWKGKSNREVRKHTDFSPEGALSKNLRGFSQPTCFFINYLPPRNQKIKTSHSPKPFIYLPALVFLCSLCCLKASYRVLLDITSLQQHSEKKKEVARPFPTDGHTSQQRHPGTQNTAYGGVTPLSVVDFHLWRSSDGIRDLQLLAKKSTITKTGRWPEYRQLRNSVRVWLCQSSCQDEALGTTRVQGKLAFESTKSLFCITVQSATWDHNLMPDLKWIILKPVRYCWLLKKGGIM